MDAAAAGGHGWAKRQMGEGVDRPVGGRAYSLFPRPNRPESAKSEGEADGERSRGAENGPTKGKERR